MKPLKIFESHLDKDINEQTETNPTEEQIKSGNYKKAKIKIQGMNISIENPKDSTRSGIDEDGNKWETTMKSHYGYFGNTKGKDDDHIDVFVGENLECEEVYVIDQINPKTKKFDESKVMLGYDSHEDAKKAYLENYDKNWKGFKCITPISIEDFKYWLYDDIKQHKPFSEYSDTPDPIK